MPIIKSAQKRARQTIVRRSRNLATKQRVRTETKALETAIANGDKKEVENRLNSVKSALDTAVKKNVIHKNKAARKKTQLVKAAREVLGSAKKTTKKAARPAAKKSTKTTTAKKPAAKKSTTKK